MFTRRSSAMPSLLRMPTRACLPERFVSFHQWVAVPQAEVEQRAFNLTTYVKSLQQ